MTGGGKDLATEGLGLIAKGLTDALAELKELGMVGEAGAGRGFSDIALSGLELGHEGLTGEFTSFCERWEWGVRSLINEGNGFAMKTGLAAGTYYENDKYVEGTFKIVENAAIGNPYASEEEVEKMGWGRSPSPVRTEAMSTTARSPSSRPWRTASRAGRTPGAM